MKSLGSMIEQLDGLRDTPDLSVWELGFVTNMVESYVLNKKSTTHLTEKQVAVIERLYSKHFA